MVVGVAVEVVEAVEAVGEVEEVEVNSSSSIIISTDLYCIPAQTLIVQHT